MQNTSRNINLNSSLNQTQTSVMTVDGQQIEAKNLKEINALE